MRTISSVEMWGGEDLHADGAGLEWRKRRKEKMKRIELVTCISRV